MKKPLLIAVSLFGLSACLNNDQLYSLGQIVEAQTGFGAKHPEALLAGAVALSVLEQQQNAQPTTNTNQTTSQPRQWEVTATEPVKMNPPAKQKVKTTKKAKTKK